MSENAVASGNNAKIKVTRGYLCEYTESDNPMTLHFEFNPSTITRTRSVDINFGDGPENSGGLDFSDVSEATRVTQGATVKAESFTLKILLDATDRMNNEDDDEIHQVGIQPELDILYYMIEPKLQKPDGATTLAALGEGGSGGQDQPFPSVLEFHWGQQSLPVLLTQIQFTVNAYLPNLVPYRAEATLTLQIIQSNNPIYMKEIRRVFNSATNASGSIQGFESNCGEGY